MEAAEHDFLIDAMEEQRPIRRADQAADHDFFIGAMETGATGYHCGSTFYRVRVGNPGKVSSSYNRTFYKTHEIMVQPSSSILSERDPSASFSGRRIPARSSCKFGFRGFPAREGVGLGGFMSVQVGRY